MKHGWNTSIKMIFGSKKVKNRASRWGWVGINMHVCTGTQIQWQLYCCSIYAIIISRQANRLHNYIHITDFQLYEPVLWVIFFWMWINISRDIFPTPMLLYYFSHSIPTLETAHKSHLNDKFPLTNIKI